MKKYLKYLIFLSVLFPSISFGAGIFTVDNVVVSGTSNESSGASLFVKGINTSSSSTPFAVNDSDGKTLIALEGDGYFKKGRARHAYGGFQWQNETIAVSGASVWAKVTNATGTLWTGLEADGMTLSGDTMYITKTADYVGIASITYSGLNGKDFVFRLYNATKSRQEGYIIGASTTSTSNYVNVALPLYMEAEAGDAYIIQVTCVTDGSDPIVRNAIFWIKYLHE